MIGHLLAQKFIGLINPFAPELPLNTWRMPVHIPCNPSDKPCFKDKFVILLVQGKEIFPAAMCSKMNAIQSRRLEKKGKKKKHVELTQKFGWKSCSTIFSSIRMHLESP